LTTAPQLELENLPSTSGFFTHESVHIKTKPKLNSLAFLGPLKIVLFLRYPAVLVSEYCARVSFFSLPVLQISLQATFIKPPYNFGTSQIGLI
jgi:hypothetical protein